MTSTQSVEGKCASSSRARLEVGKKISCMEPRPIPTLRLSPFFLFLPSVYLTCSSSSSSRLVVVVVAAAAAAIIQSGGHKTK